MDHEQQPNQAVGQETNFSDTICFQPPLEESGELTAEATMAEFLPGGDPSSLGIGQEPNAFDERPLEERTIDVGKMEGRGIFLAPEMQMAAEPQETPLPEPLADALPEQEPAEEEATVVAAPKRRGTTGWTVVWAISKFIWKLALGVALAAVVLIAGLVGYLTVTEYTPSYAETADRGSVNRSESISGRALSILTFDTGYAALGTDADLYKDGGEGVRPESQEIVENNLQGIEGILGLADADFILLQEVDTDSARSFNTNQWLRYEYHLKEYESRFAMNHSCDYVPYPYTEPTGKVRSGLATYSRYDIVSATRYSLTNGSSWPARVADPKQCLLVTRIPIEDTNQQLVLINVHMEAQNEEVRGDQIKQLLDLVKEEYGKGNFVIAGGVFNSYFPGGHKHEIKDPDFWTPGKLKSVGGNYRYVYDDENPTCRLLNQPYDPDSYETQYYVVDGFLVSPNVSVTRVETMDYEFIYSNHNPVRLDVMLTFFE